MWRNVAHKEMMDSLRMKDMVVSDRPRERLLREGQEVLSNSELLAILLRTGTKGSSALQVAQAVLQRAGGLEPLTRETVEGLCTVPGVGPDKAVTVIAALTLARRLARESAAEAPLLDTPERVVELLREENRAYEVEQLQVVLVNTRRRLLRVERLASGTLDTLLVHPREVFRAAIAAGDPLVGARAAAGIGAVALAREQVESALSAFATAASLAVEGGDATFASAMADRWEHLRVGRVGADTARCERLARWPPQDEPRTEG